MFDRFENRLELTGVLKAITAVRVSAGRSTEPIGSDLPVLKDSLGQPLIPGASFKGAMRSRLESFLRAIDPDLAKNPIVENEWSVTKTMMDDFREAATSDADLTQKINAATDLAARVFGSPWIASKFQVRDLTVQPGTWFGQYQERDGVAIDRDTETAANQRLYDYQVVPAGTTFDFHAVVENARPEELGLLMIGLHQFQGQQIPLGGGRSRGLGVVELSLENPWWFDVAEEGPQGLVKYLGNLASGDISEYRRDEADFTAKKKAWTQALIHVLSQPNPAQYLAEATQAF